MPKSINLIGDYAFGYYTHYEYIGSSIYASRIYMGKKQNNFKLSGYKGTVTEKYANDNGFEFVDLTVIESVQSSEPTEPSTNPTTPTPQPTVKKTQKITAKSYTKTYGAKAFNLKAKSSGNGKLTYKTNDKKVVTVSAKGKITIKGCGKAVITIKAAATSDYNATSKKIAVTVKPGKLKVTGYKKGSKITFKPQPNVDGYVAKAQKVKSNYKKNYSAGKNKKYISVKGLPKGKYNIKLSAWKKISGKKIFGKEAKVIIVIG